jgi:hypothetical protein
MPMTLPMRFRNGGGVTLDLYARSRKGAVQLMQNGGPDGARPDQGHGPDFRVTSDF